MRMLITATLPHETFNTAVRDGSADQKMKAILDNAKPEAVYFTDTDGHRSVMMIADMADASQLPALVEPWFLTFNADVKLQVIMGPDDLQKAGLDALGKKWG